MEDDEESFSSPDVPDIQVLIEDYVPDSHDENIPPPTKLRKHRTTSDSDSNCLSGTDSDSDATVVTPVVFSKEILMKIFRN